MPEALLLDGGSLTLEDVGRVSAGSVAVALHPQAEGQVQRARDLVERQAASDAPIYGLNTGFGFLADVKISPKDVAALQRNLIRSHAAGVGPPLSAPQTRALMLLRANVMATGRSGVRLETLQLLLDMLNADVLPVVPSKGSVGASGDLAPLAHLALAMLGEGEAILNGERLPSADALRSCNLSPLAPEAKEGLCLINGTQAMAALGSIALLQAERLVDHTDLAGAVSLEGHRGTQTAFDPLIQQVRPHTGQTVSAAYLRYLLRESEIAESHIDCDRVQDAYSFRCMPQVHGATRDVLAFVRKTLTVEINSATDNPLVFAEEGEGDRMLSGGNFHGQPLAMALDFLAIAVSELANISDRRVEQLIDPALSGLPPFLMRNAGLNSGFMMAQVTSASLVNENRVLCTPASADSIPTSANREDHVSMGMTSARKVLTVLENAQYCIAIELLAGCQALDLLGGVPGLGVRQVYNVIRQHVSMMEEDRPLHLDIEAVRDLMVSGALLAATGRSYAPGS